MKTKKALFAAGMALMLVAGIVAGSLAGPAPVALAAETAAPVKAITVQGASSVTVAPTVAYVQVGVATFNKVAATAQTDNAKKMDAVYKALAALGIAKEKIQTVSYYISPRYDYKDNTTVLAGYDVINTIQVTTDLAKVSKVIDLTVQQGVNQANAISFGITDAERDAYYLQALEKAVQNAKAKAAVLAKAGGVTIGGPAQIIENSSGYVSPIPYPMYERAMADEAASTPISGGELKVEAAVTVIYNY